MSVGYPQHAARQDAPFTTAEVDGWIPTASGLEDTPTGRQPGHLVLKAEGSPPRELPTKKTELGMTPWAGMSGAAVFAAGRLVGVVAEHHLPEGDGSLTVVPIEWVDRLQDATDRAVMLEALGVASGDDLEVLRPGAATRRRWTSVIPRAPLVLVERPAQQEELRRAVLAKSDAPVVVCGMGGAGKSVLAARLARTVLDGTDLELTACCPEGVAWVLVGRERQVIAAQLELARALGEERPDLGVDWRSNRGRLQQLAADRRGLVVLDDVWTAEHYEPFRLNAPRVRVVVTTRNQELASDLGAVLVPVGELESGQSRRLLADAAGVVVDRLPEEAEELLSEVGHLALGVAMVGAMAAGRGSQVWTGLLGRIRQRRLDKVAHRFADNYEYATLLRAIEVAVDDLKPDDRQNWAELAVFAGQGEIPRSAMKALWSSADEDDLDTDDRIDRLRRRSLIQRGGGGRYRLHDLQYDVADLRLGENRGAVHERLVDGYRQRVATSLNTPTSIGWAHLLASLTALPRVHPVWPVADDGYLLDHLIVHLRAAGQQQIASELLGNYDWISLGVSRRSFGRLLVDYDQLPASDPLRLVRESLARSRQSLLADPDSLSDQLLGRLAEVRDPGITSLLDRIQTEQARRPLEIIRSGLSRPSGLLLHTLTGHQDSIRAVAVTGDGRAVTGSDDGTAMVWDLASGQQLHALTGHRDSIRAVAVTGDGRAVTGSTDGTAMVWDLASGRQLHALTGHRGWILAVAVTGDGRAVTGSTDGTAMVWDLASGRQLHALTGHRDSIRAVAVTGDGRAVTGSTDGTAMVWDLASGRQLHALTGHQGWISAVAVTGDGRAVTGSADGTAMVWDLASGRQLHALTGHRGWIRAVAVTGDGRAVTGSADRAAMVWDLASGRQLHALTGHRDSIRAVAVTGDGRAVTGSTDRAAMVWDLASGRQLHALTGHRDSIRAVAVTGDGRAVTGSTDGTAMVWDLASGRQLHALTGHQGSIRAVAVTGDGRAVTGSTDGTAMVWDLASGRQLHALTGHRDSIRAVAVTGDGRAVTGSTDGTAMVWDLASGRQLHALTGHQGWILAVAVTGDGRAVTGSTDGTAMVWDLASGRQLHALTGHQGWILAVAVTGDGRAVTGSTDGTAMVWDLASGRQLHALTGHRDSIRAVAVTGDGRAVTGSTDGTAMVWDLASGRQLHALTGHQGWISAVAVTGDGRAVTGSTDRTAMVWDLASGRQLHALTGHRDSILAVAVTGDGRAVTGSTDRTAIIWDLASGRSIAVWYGDATMMTLGTDGRSTFIGGDALGNIYVLRSRDGHVIQLAAPNQNGP